MVSTRRRIFLIPFRLNDGSVKWWQSGVAAVSTRCQTSVTPRSCEGCQLLGIGVIFESALYGRWQLDAGLAANTVTANLECRSASSPNWRHLISVFLKGGQCIHACSRYSRTRTPPCENQTQGHETVARRLRRREPPGGRQRCSRRNPDPHSVQTLRRQREWLAGPETPRRPPRRRVG